MQCAVTVQTSVCLEQQIWMTNKIFKGYAKQQGNHGTESISLRGELMSKQMKLIQHFSDSHNLLKMLLHSETFGLILWLKKKNHVLSKNSLIVHWIWRSSNSEYEVFPSRQFSVTRMMMMMTKFWQHNIRGCHRNKSKLTGKLLSGAMGRNKHNTLMNRKMILITSQSCFNCRSIYEHLHHIIWHGEEMLSYSVMKFSLILLGSSRTASHLIMWKDCGVNHTA